MRHLVGLVSALVDGHLPSAVAERLLAHAVVCPPCRVTLADERKVKAALVDTPAPEPPIDLIRKLLEVPAGRPAVSQAGEVPRRL